MPSRTTAPASRSPTAAPERAALPRAPSPRAPSPGAAEALALSLDERDGPRLRAVAKALASEPRWRLLTALGEQLRNVGELAEALAMPPSTVAMHLGVLEEAGLVRTEYVPGQRGRQRVCQRVFDQVRVDLPRGHTERERDIVESSLPVGAYADADVVPTCGLAGPDAIIGLLDDPTAFYEPDHMDAQLVWFRHGRLAYRFPNRLPPRAQVDTLWFIVELCSEAPMHHHDWPSDVTVWVNGVRLGHWTSPADFGGRRGQLTPAWWDARNTQYGVLKEWRVTESGSFVDGLKLSDVTIDELDLGAHPYVEVAIGVEPDARHVGGLNLFGRGFGNYPQDLVLRLRHRPVAADGD
ncbi:MAG: ArsR/SmtB family transcription factor [Trueperaceae bacterium]